MASRNQARRAAVQALYTFEVDAAAAVPVVRQRLVDALDKPPERELTAEEQAERDMAEEARERLEEEERLRGNTVVAFKSLSRPVPEEAEAEAEDSAAAEFGWSLVRGVREHVATLDGELTAATENWSLSRMAVTDRCVLRVGLYELRHTETPRSVVIDQAVRLAKTFGSEKSGAFVNGVLDRLAAGAVAVPESGGGSAAVVEAPVRPTETGALANRLPMEGSGSTSLAERMKRKRAASPAPESSPTEPSLIEPTATAGGGVDRAHFAKAYDGPPPPWEIGRPQPAFVEQAGLVSGPVLDVGCGTGELTRFLAGEGHAAVGVDLFESAIAEARRRAEADGTPVRFETADATALAGRVAELGGPFATATDCGVFHVFDDEDRERYVDGLRAAVREGGRVLVLCFSDAEPAGAGPRRVSEIDLRAAFSEGFFVESVEAVRFVVRPEVTEFSDGGPRALFAVIRREE